MDIVFIEALEVETVIGIHDWEREVRQNVVLDLEMGTDIRRAADTENIENTLNYQSISERLIEFIGSSRFLLVETMAEEIANLLINEFQIGWLKLKLAKPAAIPQARSVGVVIERGDR